MLSRYYDNIITISVNLYRKILNSLLNLEEPSSSTSLLLRPVPVMGPEKLEGDQITFSIKNLSVETNCMTVPFNRKFTDGKIRLKLFSKKIP